MKFQKKKDIKKREFYSKYEMKKIYSKYLLSQSETLKTKSNLDASSKLEGSESVTEGQASLMPLKDLQEGVFVLSSTWRERLKKSYKVPRQSSKVRLRGRCLRTNRPRSVSQLLKISRQECRRLALDGQIPGVTRSTW